MIANHVLSFGMEEDLSIDYSFKLFFATPKRTPKESEKLQQFSHEDILNSAFIPSLKESLTASYGLSDL